MADACAMPPLTANRRVRRGAGAQSMIEFALVLMLLMLGLMGATAAAIWGVDGMGAATAAEEGARLAVSAQNVGTAANQVDLCAAYPAAARLRQEMAGTSITFVKVGTSCTVASPTSIPITSAASCPGNTTGINVCVSRNAANRMVTVQVTGCVNTMVPTVFSFKGCQSGVPLNQIASVHELVFEP